MAVEYIIVVVVAPMGFEPGSHFLQRQRNLQLKYCGKSPIYIPALPTLVIYNRESSCGM